ncbi:MAG: nicotianamine synthase family protein [bacterium]|nr:MAG: nicotianamine synthase family protein [bacterium]
MSNITKLKKIISKIQKLKSFKPSERVNGIFTDLVNLALVANHQLKVGAKDYELLQKSASSAEYELEKHWSSKIIKNGYELKNFPYYNNYLELTKVEWNSLLSCKTHHNHNVLFIGSGPLPLTAIILARDYNCDITIIDISSKAIDLSRKLIKKIGLNDKITAINADALSFQLYKNFDVIYLAALAGIDRGVKRKILKKIRLDSIKGVHLIARSSFGNREMLYKPLSNNDIEGFKLDLEVRPYNGIVNSFLILRK